MLKFGGHILLRNTCPVPVGHHQSWELSCTWCYWMHMEKCLIKLARLWLLDFVWFVLENGTAYLTRVYHFVDSLYIGSEDRPCFHGCAELKKSSCVQMFFLDIPGSFMIPQHHLNFETKCSIPLVLTSPMEPLDILLALSCTFLFQWRCIGSFFHNSLVSMCFQNVSMSLAKRCNGLATCKKVRNIFYRFLLKLKKKEWQGENPTKLLWKNCAWSRVPDKVEALQNGSGVFLFFSEHECKRLTIFGCKYQNRSR